MKEKNNTGIIILAAGNSSRLGQPKQLLSYNNTTLLNNTIDAALQIPNAIVIVVLGSEQELIEQELNSPQIKISYNKNWISGMSSSIVKGLSDLLTGTVAVDSCIISVCDQPFINNSVFENLLKEHNSTGVGIVASSYSGTVGIPVLFSKKYFKELLELKGQEGAKKLIGKFSDDCVSVAFLKGGIDIDTPEDYKHLISLF